MTDVRLAIGHAICSWSFQAGRRTADPSVALELADQGRAALEQAGLRGGDAATLLVTLAEIEEALGRFADARVTIPAAIVTLADAEPELIPPR